MTTAGPNFAGTAAQTGAGTAWTNTGNSADGSNNTYASCSLSGAGTSQTLVMTNPGFAIPAAAVVNGITWEIERKSNSNSSSISIKDVNVYLVLAGTLQTGTNKADTVTLWPTTDTFKTYGGSSDLWGQGSLTGADINNSGFGVALKCGPNGLSRTATVDGARCTIDYTYNGEIRQASFFLSM